VLQQDGQSELELKYELLLLFFKPSVAIPGEEKIKQGV